MSTSDDALCFFSGSKDVAPGKGARERVAVPGGYALLAATPGWRRTLSNFHEHEFTYEGATFRTIEHAFQAAKIALADPAKAREFALDSGSALATGGGLAARKARKLVVLTAPQIAAWNALSRGTMAAIARAKYARCAEARAVLLATGSAQLHHIVPRQRDTDRFVHLEEMREEMREV